jgi:hypothetical protein
MNNQTQADLEQKEQEQYDYFVKQKQALERLEKNPDFKLLILEGYFKDRAINLVSALGSDYVRRSGTRGELIEEANSISMLQQYFITIKKMGAEIKEEDLMNEKDLIDD